jgi:hypothetical protein
MALVFSFCDKMTRAIFERKNEEQKKGGGGFECYPQ